MQMHINILFMSAIIFNLCLYLGQPVIRNPGSRRVACRPTWQPVRRDDTRNPPGSGPEDCIPFKCLLPVLRFVLCVVMYPFSLHRAVASVSSDADDEDDDERRGYLDILLPETILIGKSQVSKPIDNVSKPSVKPLA